MKQALKGTKKATFFLFCMAVTAFFQTTIAQVKQSNSPQSSSNFKPIDTTAIERIMGMKGKANNGEYKITIPQNDLDVKVDGFKITPPMG